MNNEFTLEQQKIIDIWVKHTMCEFETKDVEETMHTMSEMPHVNHVPVMTGGFGRDNVQNCYCG